MGPDYKRPFWYICEYGKKYFKKLLWKLPPSYESERKIITAGKKLVWIRGIKSCQSIGLIIFKLLIDDSMIVLVQFLVLRNLLPYAMSVVVI